MRQLVIATMMISTAASAEVYKCGNKYQPTPCEGAKVVEIKKQTEEQKAASAERLQQVRSEYETTKQQRAEAADKEFEKSIKISELQAAQQNAFQQGRQADALEQEAAKPVPFMVPPGFHQVIPPKD